MVLVRQCKNSDVKATIFVLCDNLKLIPGNFVTIFLEELAA